MKARPAMARPPKTRAAPASPAPSRRLHFKQPDVNAGSAPSSPVFVNQSGSPMIFYVPPCSSGGELRRLITAGGGKVSEKAGKNVINLMPEGLKHKKLQKLEDAISSSFVVDCMSRKTLLPLSTYRLAGAAAPAQAAGSAASAPSRAPAAKASPAHPARGQKREKFTREDDAALVEWVRKNPDLKSQGKDIWVRAANAKVTHHSWQSMQNRYRRQLKEKKGDGLRRAMACGAAAQGPAAAPAPSKASENGAAPVVVVDDDLIEDFSQTRAPKRKAEAPQASIERKTSMRTSLSTWKRRKERQRAAAAEAAPAYQPPTALATAMAQASPRISVQPTPDIFRGVPQWILDTQDLEKPADISLLL